MLAATMVKMSNSENKYMNKNTYNISSIKCVTRKFLEVSCCSHAKQWQRNIEKSVLHVKSCFFAYQTYCCFLTILIAFATQHYTILYFAGANYKYYRELCLQPWLNLYIIFQLPLLKGHLFQGKGALFPGFNLLSGNTSVL